MTVREALFARHSFRAFLPKPVEKEKLSAILEAAQTVLYPDIIHRAAHIPDNLHIGIGIAIGYVDRDNKINNFTSSRDPLETAVHWAG
jgi:nitroreductase